MVNDNTKQDSGRDSDVQSRIKRGSVKSYLLWRDPKSSAIVFGAGLILLFSLAYCSLISVISNLCLAILFFTFGLRIYNDFLKFVQKKEGTHMYSSFLRCDVLSQEKAHGIVDVVIVHLNAFLIELRRLFLIEDYIQSLKFALMLCVLRYIGAWFNGLTIVIIAFVSAFTLPKIYENNKSQIDQYLDLIRNKIEEVTNRIRDTIQPLLSRRMGIKKE